MNQTQKRILIEAKPMLAIMTILSIFTILAYSDGIQYTWQFTVTQTVFIIALMILVFRFCWKCKLFSKADKKQ